MTKKKVNPFKKNKYEIFYKLINAAIAGALVFLGAITDGGFNNKTIVVSLIVSLIVIITQFRDYWASQESEYSKIKVHMIAKFI